MLNIEGQPVRCVETNDEAIELNQKILAVQQELFAAHMAQTSLVEEVRNLKDQIARMKDWDIQKQRYKLASPHEGGMVYALQKAMSNGEPAHYICTGCYEQGKRSILQCVPDKDRWTMWLCTACKTSARTGYRGGDQPRFAEDIPVGGF